jgi:hypothetical protein
LGKETRASLTQSTSPGKQPQGRGPNEIGGSLLKRWSMWFNSTVHGAPYQPQLRLRRRLRARGAWPDRGAAWLSSVRVVRRGIRLPNERSPPRPSARPVRRPPRCSGLRGRQGLAPLAAASHPDRGRSQVNMAYIGGATHVLQGPAQRAATAKAGATPQSRPQFGLRDATRA